LAIVQRCIIYKWVKEGRRVLYDYKMSDKMRRCVLRRF
jgi:hypothetical protein